MPVVSELSTVEWQSAQVMPTRRELTGFVDFAHHADDSIQPQQRHRHGRIVEIDLSCLERLDDSQEAARARPP